MLDNHPPTAAPPPTEPVTRAEFNNLRLLMDSIYRRTVRTETRLMRLLEHHGLDAAGQKSEAQDVSV